MSAGGFKDHFSAQAEAYRRHRPGYPAALFDWLALQTPGHARAWDCATGNGQAARGLARHFGQVDATDASAAQIAAAAPCARVRYRVAPAAASGLADTSTDLVTVAQAAHWFDLGAFYTEVHRVARPGAVIALWGYGLLRIDAALDAVIGHLYHEVLGPYWPPERRHVDTAYRSLPFPFARIAAPGFAMTARWTLEALLGYLGSWSAVQAYRAQTGSDPVTTIATRLRAAWGRDPRREVVWPLFLHAGIAARGKKGSVTNANHFQ